MEHKGTRPLETPRLLLRPFRESDAGAMFRNWASDPEVTRYLTWPAHRTQEDSRRIARLWQEQSDDPRVYQWAVVLKSIGEPIGGLSVVRMNENVSAMELGWCIGRRWWGQGLMPEAARAVADYLFGQVGVLRLAACHDSENGKSGRVMQKLGMVREGTLRRHGRNNRGIVDEVVYSVLAEEWQALRRKEPGCNGPESVVE